MEQLTLFDIGPDIKEASSTTFIDNMKLFLGTYSPFPCIIFTLIG
jgi:hypothetical protein